MLLGAGVSRGIGLPGWADLVKRCCAALGVGFDPNELTSKMDEVYDAGRSQHPPLPRETIVRDALYRDVGDRYSIHDLRKPLLLALGAITMTGARHGSTDIFTWNFDDVLESYLVAHGFGVQVITTDAFDVRGDVDVHVYHQHGYLPLLNSDRASDLVLSRDEFLERLSDDTSKPWSASLISQLQSRTAICIGLSFKDDNLMRLIRIASKHTTSRPIGYSLNVHSESRSAELRRSSIIPVQFNSHDEIPDFILSVCKSAARSVNL